jgi:hypothetical protein
MLHALLTSVLLAVPNAVLACPVCFGENDSPLAAGMNQGIFAMLLLTIGVLAGFASFFIHLMRRARMTADRASAASSGDARHGVAHGGTV